MTTENRFYLQNQEIKAFRKALKHKSAHVRGEAADALAKAAANGIDIGGTVRALGKALEYREKVNDRLVPTANVRWIPAYALEVAAANGIDISGALGRVELPQKSGQVSYANFFG